MNTDQPRSIVTDTDADADADDADEAIRAINHRTIAAPDGIPAPVLYAVLGNLKTAGGHGLSQALAQLATGLGRSLATHDVYEDDGRDPVHSIAQAVDDLTTASQHAAHIGVLLEHAQGAIRGQGYRTSTDA